MEKLHKQNHLELNLEQETHGARSEQGRKSGGENNELLKASGFSSLESSKIKMSHNPFAVPGWSDADMGGFNLWKRLQLIIRVSFGLHLLSFPADPTKNQAPSSHLFVSLGFGVVGLLCSGFWVVFF